MVYFLKGFLEIKPQRMKNILSLSLALLIGMAAWSQDWDFSPPNYQQIASNIASESSPYFYKTLMQRFKSGDTTMTIEEKRHLYYGYSFQKEYAPYSHSEYLDSIQAIMQKGQNVISDLDDIIRYGDEVLKENPFDLRAISYQLFALEQQGDQEAFMPKLMQFRAVIEAMLSTGDGISKETAFHVIYTAHEYVLVDILGFAFGGTQSLIEHYDYLTLAENVAGLEGMYFDVKVCLNSMSKLFGE